MRFGISPFPLLSNDARAINLYQPEVVPVPGLESKGVVFEPPALFRRLVWGFMPEAEA
jgi:hypothetical protein